MNKPFNTLFTGQPQQSQANPTVSSEEPPVQQPQYSLEEERYFHNISSGVSGRSSNIFSMASSLKLEKFKVDGTQNINAWLTIIFFNGPSFMT